MQSFSSAIPSSHFSQLSRLMNRVPKLALDLLLQSAMNSFDKSLNLFLFLYRKYKPKLAQRLRKKVLPRFYLNSQSKRGESAFLRAINLLLQNYKNNSL